MYPASPVRIEILACKVFICKGNNSEEIKVVVEIPFFFSRKETTVTSVLLHLTWSGTYFTLTNKPWFYSIATLDPGFGGVRVK